MPLFLVLLIYNLLFPFALLAMAPSALRKMKQRGGTWGDLWQRLGFFSQAQKSRLTELHQKSDILWMHAVSVGEVEVGKKLITEMMRQKPALSFVLSTTTPTGFALAGEFARLHPQNLMAIYNPLDGWFSVRRCLSFIRPAKIVLVEAELWPNFLHAAAQRHIPVALVNARLSPRSERRYKKFQFFVRPVFGMLSRVFVQEPEDVARWAALGVPPERIEHSGSIKFDMHGQPEPTERIVRFRSLLESTGWTASKPVLLAASTHDGEEIEIAKVFRQLRADHPDLSLIIVPRHVERAGKIEDELKGMGFTLQRRSLIENGAGNDPPPDILLVDTTGELRAWQYLATVVVIGKSFLATGGQNPAEALMAGKPVLFGPHMENFEALVRMLLGKSGALEVRDFAELTQRVSELLKDPAKAAALASAGREALHAHEGATQRVAARLLSAHA